MAACLLGPLVLTPLGAGATTAAVSVVQAARSSQTDLVGPARLAPAEFDRPTKRGRLLVAAVLCGIVNAGMKVPALSLPDGWRLAGRRLGGVQRGLEVAVYYEPNNPGGVRSVPLDANGATSVRRGSEAWCTTFTWELRGARKDTELDTWGTKSVIQRSSDPASRSITVKTTGGTASAGDLVLLAETDGSSVPVSRGLYRVTKGYVLRSQWDNGQEAQPGTLSYELAPAAGPLRGTVSQWSNWIDACAVMVVLGV